ncbi:MAG: hypothetical protein N4A46_15875 [Schleiferiaceae bacterium]|nr:hypothetical protein [Schleiferiaceae bacterium]
MRLVLFVLSTVLFLSCSNKSSSQVAFSQRDTVQYIANITHDSIVENLQDNNPVYPVLLSDSISYSKRKVQAERLRQTLQTSYANGLIDIDSVGNAFEYFLLNNIVPHWYGTPWDFEGHTNDPGEGEVACGYFVSTTLRHMNIQINRYHLAQQAAYNGAKSLAINFDHISKYSEIADFESKIDDGLYMVGLSYHVGYLLKHKNELFFIHSNYMGDVCVMIEDAYSSEALNSSSIYVLVRIGNSDLMKAWLSKENVKVYR